MTEGGGLVRTLLRLFAQGGGNGRRLWIRPDDVWLAIVHQFGLYVLGRAVWVGDYFVENGRSVLTGDCVAEWSWQAALAIRDWTVRDWLLPRFSTTQEQDKLFAAAAVLTTPANACRISSGDSEVLEFSNDRETPLEVELLGSAADWEDVARRTDRLRDFELPGSNLMEKWTRMLRPVVEALAAQKRSKTSDRVWWNRAVRFCGDGRFEGWAATLAVFGADGRWLADDVDGKGWPRIPTDRAFNSAERVGLKLGANDAPEENHLVVYRFEQTALESTTIRTAAKTIGSSRAPFKQQTIRSSDL